jgi:hypothetical protein
LQNAWINSWNTKQFFADLSSSHERSRRVQLMKPAAQALPPIFFKDRGVLPSQIICCVTDEVKK